MNKRDEAVWGAVEAVFRGGKLSKWQIASTMACPRRAIWKRSQCAPKCALRTKVRTKSRLRTTVRTMRHLPSFRPLVQAINA